MSVVHVGNPLDAESLKLAQWINEAYWVINVTSLQCVWLASAPQKVNVGVVICKHTSVSMCVCDGVSEMCFKGGLLSAFHVID